MPLTVIPAKAGIQHSKCSKNPLFKQILLFRGNTSVGLSRLF